MKCCFAETSKTEKSLRLTERLNDLLRVWVWGGHWLNRTHRDFVCVFVCLTVCLNSCVKRTRVSFLVCGGRHLFTASMKMSRTCEQACLFSFCWCVYLYKAFHIYFQWYGFCWFLWGWLNNVCEWRSISGCLPGCCYQHNGSHRVKVVSDTLPI